MTNKKPTDNEIKKAFEYCYIFRRCNGCPFDGEIKACNNVEKNAFDYINRLEAKNERLREKVKRFEKIRRAYQRYINEDDLNDFEKHYKAEAYKEFAERLMMWINKELYPNKSIPFGIIIMVEDAIIRILKELVGDKE